MDILITEHFLKMHPLVRNSYVALGNMRIKVAELIDENYASLIVYRTHEVK